MLKHYVRFYYPGTLFNESSVKEVKKRDVKIKVPKGAYAYQFYSVEERLTKDGEVLRGTPKNESHLTVKGEVWTLARIKRELPEETILISNVSRNKYEKVIRTFQGQFIPTKKDAVVVKEWE